MTRCNRAHCAGSYYRDDEGLLRCLSCSRPALPAPEPLPLLKQEPMHQTDRKR